jgi:ubiquitin C-terminal hydrolase
MLQVLSHSLKFRQFLESHPSVNTNMVETQLRAFMARMWAPENDERYITPVEFFDALHRIRPLEFQRGTMSDANEALITILDELADSLIPLPSDATASIESSSLRDSNILNSVFAVHDTQTLTCLECFRVSETHTRVSQMILSLPDVGEQAGAGSSHLSTLYELFATYTGEEIIPEYACENCSPIRRMAGQTHRISNTSDVVSITLNRFTAAGVKNRVPVRIPLVLDMDLVPGSTATGVYKLVGVVYHFGRSRGFGHYTAHVLNSQSTQWLNMDDSVVTPLPRLGSYHTAIESGDAYMLMYDRME